jgi:hypothetical protein
MKLEELTESEETELAKIIRNAFSKHKLSVHGIKDFQRHDDYDRFIIKGAKSYIAGPREELQFVIQCTMDQDREYIDGMIHAQRRASSRKLELEKDLDEDDYTLEEFAEHVNDFISDIIKKEKDSYAEGLRDYIKKGGRGMMPGSVKKDYR